jgi:hypothetical protein
MDRLNQWLTLLANFGVLIGIIFLVVEIQQNTTMMRATTSQERSGDLLELIGMATESDVLLSALSKLDFPKGICGADEGALDSLTDLERTAFKHYVAANLIRIQNLQQQYEYGLLDDFLLKRILAALKLYGAYARKLDIPQEGVAVSILANYDDPEVPMGWCD